MEATTRYSNIFLSKQAQALINSLRGEKGCVDIDKSLISDAISIIMKMYQNCTTKTEQNKLIKAIDTLTEYNDLLTELSRENDNQA